MFKKILIISSILCVSFWGLGASAQVRDTDISINISPEFPSLNQEVNASIKTFVTDLNKAYISWSVNNERKSAGVGKTEFSFNTGNLSNISLSVAIDTVTGQSIIKTINITPANIDLLWEAMDSYTPPFYKGKALVESEGTYKVVAIPFVALEGKPIHSANLSYAWKKDGGVERSSSGWSKDFFVFKNSYIDRGNRVEVAISDVLGQFNTNAEIFLSVYQPKLVFYEKDPILGIKMERSLRDGYFIDKEGLIIEAVPYFISPKNLNADELSWQWTLGNQEVARPDKPNEISIRPEQNRRGESVVKLVISNTKAFFAGVEHKINVNF